MRHFFITTMAAGALGMLCSATFAANVTQTVAIEGTTRVEVNAPAALHVHQGDHESLVLTADERDMKHMRVKLEQGVLTIDTDDHNHLNFSDDRRVYITLTVKSLNALHLNTAGTVDMAAFKTDRIDLGIAGAGTMDIKDLHADHVDLSIAGAGEIDATGSANAVNVQVSGIGGATLDQLDSKTTHVAISGGGSVKVDASDDLDATISGFGEIRYRGSPHVVKSISGVGSVEPIGAS